MSASLPQPVVTGFALSPQQQRLWLLGEAAGQGAPYAACGAFLVTGPLDGSRLRAAVERVAARHEILRTTFERPPGMSLPLQRIAAPGELPPSWLPAALLAAPLDAGTAPPDAGTALPAAAARQTGGAPCAGCAAEAPALLARFRERLGGRTAATPPLRLCLTPLAPAGPLPRHLLLVDLPPLCADAAALALLAAEIGRAYAAAPAPANAAQPAAAPDHSGAEADSPMQYADFAAWQNELLDSPQARLEADRWRQREDLAAVLAATLPGEAGERGNSGDAGHGGLGGDTGQGDGGAAPRPFALAVLPIAATAHETAELAAATAELARRHGAPPAAVLLACWQVLLFRRGGQASFAVGVLCPGREFAELAGMLGPAASYVPVACALEETRSWRQALRDAAAALAEAGERKDTFSWEVLARHLGRREEALYPAWAFACDAAPGAAQTAVAAPAPAAAADPGAPEARFTPAARFVCSERFHLELACGGDAGLELALRYDAGRFEGAAAGRLAAGFSTLLGTLATIAAATPAQADRAIGELPVLGPQEERELLGAAPPVELPGAGSCLHELVAAQARLTPERVAVRGAAASLSYRELAHRAGRLARRLALRNIGADSRVAVCVERSPEMVAALLGILAAGAAYVPLDPDHPAERLAGILADTAPALLVAQRSLLARLPAGGPAAPPILCLEEALAGATGGRPRDKKRRSLSGDGGLQSIGSPPATPRSPSLPSGGEGDAPTPDARTSFFLDLPAAAAGTADRTLPPARPDSLAYVLYTSGSSGRPKGVMVSHRAIVNRLLWMQQRFPLAADDRVLHKTSYGFDASIWEIFSPLMAGAALVLARPQEQHDAAALVAAVAIHGATVLQLVPSLLDLFLREPGVAAAGACLRRLFCGGEELTPALARRCNALLAAELCNLYGPTEAAIDATYWACPRAPAPAAVPIGRPLANVEVILVNSLLAAVPPGVAGELLIGGAGLARGYLGRADLTAERFVPHPFGGHAGARLYRTGDLARRLPGGELEYLGRIDRQVKVRGVRIELREIEALLAACPGVRQAVVVARGEGSDRRLVAYVTGTLSEDAAAPDAGPAPAPAELRAALVARLPAAMVPGDVVALRALPLTSSGKLDWQALPDPAALRPASGSAAPDAAPRTPTEQLLAGIWAEVLGRERVEAGDNFFDLGGHSLAALRVISRVRNDFGVELRVQDLFQAPTIAGLGRQIDAAVRAGQGQAAPPFAHLPRRDGAPLSFAQQRLWFLEQLRPGTALYNIPDALRFHGAFDLPALAAALAEIVRRHEALRTTFPSERGTPRQRIHPPAPLPLPLVDLAALPPAPRAAVAARWIARQARMPFDLTRWPLLRITVLRLRHDQHLVALAVHHIVSDAWSSGVLLREVALLYRAAATGRPAALPPLPYQYGEFAHWQRGWLQGEALAAELAYWRRQLAGAPPLLALPADRPRPALPSFAGATRPVLLPAVQADALRALSRRHGVTLFMTLIAAFAVVLRHQLPAGQGDDVVIGTDFANRNRAETEGLIGFFINQAAVRSDLSGDPACGELLARVRAVLLGAYAHQDVPFDLVVDALGVERSLRHHPLFQVKLFLENTPAAAFRLPGLEVTPLEVHAPLAKLDLTLALWEKPEGLTGWLNWSTDLFDAPRMARLVRQLTTVAAVMAARPEAKLSELDEILADLTTEERAMEKSQLRDMSFKKWKAVRPQAVTLPEVDVVERGTLAPGETLPLVIRPLVADLDLADWAVANAAQLESDLLRHGAILFRGFGIDTPETFEGFARTLCPDLFNENGEHPRESVSGNVYTPVFYPPDQRLLWHNENSFNWSWPRKIFFCCAQPAEQGGETPIVDSRRVYAEMDDEVRERFATRGVLYQRNYAEGLGLPWQTVFQAATREEVERQCVGSRVKVEWREGGSLRTRAVRPAVAKHPESGETSWFNQAQHWHVACLDEATRRSMRALFADAELPRHCYYGDGEPIADQHMQAVLAAYERLEVTFPWQRGDVLLLDNLLTAHGRNPFKGQRKILVAMGQMTSYEEV
ncbi:MAG TPA: amino acid adenylation domain-containing protein [Thermoanaerobaculia bacterium]|nr:amino acid adenylation domain-containing protein [Thermoanaerobaculia bacterium]